jgi:hypothetical protein
MRCSSAEWVARNGCALRWFQCLQVNWGNCGIPWVNCAVLCVWKTTGKNSSEACATACQKCAVYSVFLSGTTSHSKAAQFNWECIASFRGMNLTENFNVVCKEKVVWVRDQRMLKRSGPCGTPVIRWRKRPTVVASARAVAAKRCGLTASKEHANGN